jgi:hypothetical protein
MTRGERTTAATDAGSDRLRMDFYELLQERAERERKWQFWRLAAGHLVVGTVLAYAFVFEQWRFIALTPVLYGIAVMDGLKYGVRLLYIQQQLVELETRLSERDPSLRWTSEYGFFGPGRRVTVEGIDLNALPELAQVILIGSIYVALVGSSLIVWTPLDGAGVFGVGVTRTVLLVGYATFTALAAVVVLVGYLHFRRVRERISALVGPRE